MKNLYYTIAAILYRIPAYFRRRRDERRVRAMVAQHKQQ